MASAERLNLSEFRLGTNLSVTVLPTKSNAEPRAINFTQISLEIKNWLQKHGLLNVDGGAAGNHIVFASGDLGGNSVSTDYDANRTTHALNEISSLLQDHPSALIIYIESESVRIAEPDGTIAVWATYTKGLTSASRTELMIHDIQQYLERHRN
jgi:hypothetical protein